MLHKLFLKYISHYCSKLFDSVDLRKKKHDVIIVSSLLFGVEYEDMAREGAFQTPLRNCSWAIVFILLQIKLGLQLSHCAFLKKEKSTVLRRP